MKARHRVLLCLVFLCLVDVCLGSPVSAARGETGSIEGTVMLDDGRPVPGVEIVLEGTASLAVTDAAGSFEFKRVRDGTHSLRFSLPPNPVVRSEVSVTAGATTTVERVVEWKVGYAESITVTSVSRRRERIVDAPAAVTTVGEEEIAAQAAHGLVPKVFEFTPGVDVTQISAVEYLVSTRGFNSNLNRRLAVLVDGRDLSDPFVGATEWVTLSVPLDELSEVELLRGPSSALYGANATGGVVSMTTRSPRDDPGGRIRLAAGESDSANFDFRWSGALGREWYLKAVGSKQRSEGFSVPRVDSVEYGRPCDPSAGPPVVTDCLPLDNPSFSELPEHEIDVTEYNVRLDKYLSNGSVLTLEYGSTDYEGPVFLNATGRGQLRNVDKPWARFSFTTDHWNVLGYYNSREAEAVNLNNGNPFLLDAQNVAVEVRTHWDLAGAKVRLVAGGSLLDEKVDANVLFAEVETDQDALFAQIDWTPMSSLKLVGALRWDHNSLHDDRISPKASILYGIKPMHTLRVGYNEGFQLPTYAEYLLYYPLFSADLGPLEQICTNAGHVCGLDGVVPVGILGNESLELEETTTWEIGYKGIIGGKALLSIDVFDSKNENFVTPLVPQLTADGRTNPDYGPWQAPEGVPDDVEQAVRDASTALLPPGAELTNFHGDPFALFLSLTTVGEVDTRGAELGLDFYFANAWRAFATYSWLDFDVQGELAPSVAYVVQPNAPERKASLGFSFDGARWDASLRARWVDDFRWINSTNFVGQVEEFTTVDLRGNYAATEQWRIGVHVANLFDDEHWEAWGGDLIGRRATVYLVYEW